MRFFFERIFSHLLISTNEMQDWIIICGINLLDYGSLYLIENSITEVILAKIEQHSWDSPDRTLSSAIRKNRLIIFTGDEKQNGPVKTRVTCQCMVKRPFSPDEMQPDRYMPMPSVHYGQNSIFGPKIMRRFCDNLIQIYLKCLPKYISMV